MRATLSLFLLSALPGALEGAIGHGSETSSHGRSGLATYVATTAFLPAAKGVPSGVGAPAYLSEARGESIGRSFRAISTLLRFQ